MRQQRISFELLAKKTGRIVGPGPGRGSQIGREPCHKSWRTVSTLRRCKPRQPPVMNILHLTDEKIDVESCDTALIVATSEGHRPFAETVINRLEPEMTYLSTHSMMTMQYLPVYDRKLVAYGLAWVAIVVTSMIALARYV